MSNRNTTRRDRNRAAIARAKPPCALCGDPIDYTLDWPNPDAYVIDHITPLNRGGTDERTNLQPAHARCNRTKSDRLDTVLLRRSGTLT